MLDLSKLICVDNIEHLIQLTLGYIAYDICLRIVVPLVAQM